MPQLAGNGLVITSSDANNTEIVLEDLLGESSETERHVLIEVISGSIQFNVGAACTSANAILTDGMKKVMSLKKGNLNYKAAAGSQSFNLDWA